MSSLAVNVQKYFPLSAALKDLAVSSCSSDVEASELKGMKYKFECFDSQRACVAESQFKWYSKIEEQHIKHKEWVQEKWKGP